MIVVGAAQFPRIPIVVIDLQDALQYHILRNSVKNLLLVLALHLIDRIYLLL